MGKNSTTRGGSGKHFPFIMSDFNQSVLRRTPLQSAPPPKLHACLFIERIEMRERERDGECSTHSISARERQRGKGGRPVKFSEQIREKKRLDGC